MGIDRPGARERHRKLTVANGRVAEIWLSRGARVTCQMITANGGGTTHWETCTNRDCLGAALSQGQPCFVHASDDMRSTHIAHVAPRTGILGLQGIEISEEVWRDVRNAIAATTQNTATPIHTSLLGAVFHFKPVLDSVTFRGDLDLKGAIFHDGIDVRNCTFERWLSVSFADFRNAPGYFHNCKMLSGFEANYVHTDQHVGFESCIFSGGVQAEGVTKVMRVDDCDVSGDLNLNYSAVETFTLDRTTISGNLMFDPFEATSLRAIGMECQSTRIGAVRASMEVDLSDARFGRRVELEIDADRLNLTGTTFAGGGRIDVKRAKIMFDRTVLDGHLTVDGKGTAAIAALRNTDVSSISLLSIDLSHCLLSEASALDAISVESTATFKDAPGSWRTKRQCTADEYAWRALNSKFRRKDWEFTSLKQGSKKMDLVIPVISATEVAATYRSLRKSLESRANEPGAADFYYGEMEMRRLDRRVSVPERAILTVYWMISGYGLRSLRAIIAILIALGVGAILLKNHGFVSPGVTFTDAVVGALESIIPGSKQELPLDLEGRMINVALKIAGPILIALAALAVRNRVRR